MGVISMLQDHKKIIDTLQTENGTLKNEISSLDNIIRQLTSALESEKEKNQRDKNWYIAEKEKIENDCKRRIRNLEDITARFGSKDSNKVTKSQFNQLELIRIYKRVNHSTEYVIAVFSALISFPHSKNGVAESRTLWDMVKDQVPQFQQGLSITTLAVVSVTRRSTDGWIALFETIL